MFKPIAGISLLLLVLLNGATSAAQTDLVDSILRRSTPDSQGPFQRIRLNARRTPSPKVDAPIEEFVTYWKIQAESGNPARLAPPDDGRKRLMEAAVQTPALAPLFLEFLPESAAARDRLKQLYDDFASRMTPAWGTQLRTFLMRNGPYFREDLVRIAGQAADRDGSSVEHDMEIEALAKLDWPRAEPLLRRFAGDAMPMRKVLAKTLLFVYSPGGQDASQLLADLRGMAEDDHAPAFVRDCAIQALMARNWTDREEWLLTHFISAKSGASSDKDGRSALLMQQIVADPDRWIPAVSKLVGNSNRTVHDKAVSWLSQFQGAAARRDALEPLLPWLFDPQWSSNYRRRWLMRAVAQVELREAIPGLFAVLNQESRVGDEVAFERAYAAMALAELRGVEAVPALRHFMDVQMGGYNNPELTVFGKV